MEIKKLWLAPLIILVIGLIALAYAVMKMYIIGGCLFCITASVICMIILLIIILLGILVEAKGVKPAEEKEEVKPEIGEEKEVSEEEKEEKLAEEKIEEALKEEVKPEVAAEEKIEESLKEEVKPEEKVAEKVEEAAEEEEEPGEEMVVCGACGALVPASSKKCPNCGAEFE